MPTQEYRNWEGVNWSTLKHILSSPKAYKHALSTTIEQTPAMLFGTAVHMAILEPHEYERLSVVIPLEFLTASGSLSTGKAAKEWMATLDPEAIPLSVGQNAAVQLIRFNLGNHMDGLKWLVRAKHRELGIRWTTQDGIDCKACPDAFGDGLLLDVKTWAPRGEFTPDAFMREAISRKYLGQLGFYAKGLMRTGVEVHQMGFIVCQSVAPFDVMVLELDIDAVDYALEEATEALDLLRIWTDEGKPDVGVAPDLQLVSLPAWAARSKGIMVDDGSF